MESIILILCILTCYFSFYVFTFFYNLRKYKEDKDYKDLSINLKKDDDENE